MIPMGILSPPRPTGYELAEAEMAIGYLDGLVDTRDEFPSQSNRSEAYRHGWLNGRDDRRHVPRASASELHEEAELILRGQP